MNEYNLNDNLVPVEFRYGLFQKNKDYEVILFDIFHPKLITTSISSGGGRANYFRFRARASKDYLEDGLPSGVEYFQDFPEQSFRIAYSKYLWMDREFFEFSKENKDKSVTAKVRFVKNTNRTLNIKMIDVLNTSA
jgi:hypothetical protein